MAGADTSADARAGLFRELGRSRSVTLRGVTSFVAGALGGAAGGLIPAAVQAVIDARRQPPGHIRRHYLVFDNRRPELRQRSNARPGWYGTCTGCK